MNKKRYFLSPIIFFLLLNLAVLFLSRLGLSIWQADRINATDGWILLFLQGLRIDVASLCWLFGVPTLFSILLLNNNALGKLWLVVLRLWLTLGSLFILFMEMATPAFIETYDFRPNRLFIEYLIYPKEVFNMLLNGHAIAVISSSVVSVIALIVYWKLSGVVSKNLVYPRCKWRPVLALCISAFMFLGARSTLQHRALNPALVAFSNDPLVNSLVLNSGYSVIFAMQQLKSEAKSAELYGKMPVQEMLDIVKQSRNRPATDYISTEIPTLTHNIASHQGKPKNIVILLEESFGAQFVGTLGGKPLSPEFDKLAQQGWLFENLYATGTRSVRGIEAVTAGFTPTPARAVVKLNKAEHGFFTIADLLKQQGYHTSFIYGGEKHFDNMATFFYGNGFETIIDEKDYTNPKFTGTWGVSDEDLFDKANEMFSQWQNQGKPFFSLVFSSSNHDPFEYPEGRIQLFDKEKATRNNAAKYADYAIGHFFELAKKSNYWQDTIFLVIADHDSRVAGDSLVPIKHFHIPALILGAGIEAKRDQRLVSQIDMPTTLLSLAGISASYPMIGYDLTQDINPNRAIMQYDQTQAMMKGEDVIILMPNHTPQGFKYDYQSQSLHPKSQPDSFAKEALAHALLGSYLYQEELYKSPKKVQE